MKKKKKKLEASYANPQRCFTTCKVHVTLEIATTIRYDSTQQNWLTLDLNMYTTNPKKKKKKKKNVALLLFLCRVDFNVPIQPP